MLLLQWDSSAPVLRRDRLESGYPENKPSPEEQALRASVGAELGLEATHCTASCRWQFRSCGTPASRAMVRVGPGHLCVHLGAPLLEPVEERVRQRGPAAGQVSLLTQVLR